jgi:hypothetical protein
MRFTRAVLLCLLIPALLALALVAAACGGEETTTLTTASASTSGHIPVVGTMFLTEEVYTTDGTMVGDIRQIRAEHWVLRFEMSDERVSGDQDTMINVDQRADGSADAWGTAVIRNDGGTWECSRYTATIAKDGLEHYVWAVYQGTGAYAGLTYYQQDHFVEIPGASKPPEEGVAITGWIQKTE